ncbi:DUF7793 family protein [Arthrobacter zhaoxinii]|uniref:DUF7793 family protein n=1 Tax=Arthrobacter zhaoxinii TaxID=2964616 RepID=UPI002107E9C5|nr:STAS/SEC14 domain-containing protein [Arthrobacter zhaoxinii]MCQ2001801.1 STAS/SEC14 domain-containing protein [Arthrobacter zhaoxinii]
MATHITAHHSRNRSHDSASGHAGTSDGVQQQSSAETQVSLSEQGHLVLVLPPGEVVTSSMAAEADAKIDRLATARKLPLLLTLTGVESVSRSARDVFGAARSLSAVAVVGVSPVDRVIATFLLGGEVQPCPTRYFTCESDALEWLSRYTE